MHVRSPNPLALARCGMLLVALVSIFLASTAHAQSKDARRIAVAPLERLGPEDPAYSTLRPHLLDTLERFPNVTTVSFAPSCNADDEACLSEEARKLEASHVLRGSVERFIDGYALHLFLLTVEDGTLRRSSRVVKGGAPTLRDSVARGACDLVQRKGCEGTLRVSGPKGARVVVNERNVGSVPYSGTFDMGRHSVSLRHNDTVSDSKTITVTYGEVVELETKEQGGALVLHRVQDTGKNEARASTTAPASSDSSSPAPSTSPDSPSPSSTTSSPPTSTAKNAPSTTSPTQTGDTSQPRRVRQHPPPSAALAPVFWTGVVASGVFVVAGTGFGISAEVRASHLTTRYAANELTPADARAFDTVRSHSAVANLGFGLATLGLVTAGVAFLIDPSAILPSSDSPANGSTARQFTVSPSLDGFAVGGRF